jgi:hypothetical protein
MRTGHLYRTDSFYIYDLLSLLKLLGINSAQTAIDSKLVWSLMDSTEGILKTK